MGSSLVSSAPKNLKLNVPLHCMKTRVNLMLTTLLTYTKKKVSPVFLVKNKVFCRRGKFA